VVVGNCIIGLYLGLHFPPQASCTYWCIRYQQGRTGEMLTVSVAWRIHQPVRRSSFRVPLHPMIEKTSVPCISHNMTDPCQLLKHF
jgi:hypothetical protein